MVKQILVLFICGFAIIFAEDEEKHVPTIEELLNLKTISSARISPDGSYVAYSVRETDFEQDAYVTQIWLADVNTGDTFQLTRGEKSSSNPKWSPDGLWLAFTSGRNDDKSQIFAIRPSGGEAFRLTDTETGISDYQWSRDGKSIAYTAREPECQRLKDRKDHMGDFFIVRKEYRHTHLWSFYVDEAMNEPTQGKQHTEGKDFSVADFAWSPDGKKIAFSATIDPDFIHWGTSDIYVFTIEDSTLEKIVTQPGPDSSPRWSPDGQKIVFSTYMGREYFFAFNSELAVIPWRGGEIQLLTSSFDEHPRLIDWNDDGIYFYGLQKTASHLFRLNPKNNKITRISRPDDLMAGSFSFTADGRTLAFTADAPASLREVFVSPVNKFVPKKMTDMSDQMRDFILGTREVISWKSKDGTEIEGVLVKSADFDPAVKHPLLCIIHGGPTGIDRPYPRGNRYYPVDVWTGRGALILRINYRGSAGYGEAFRTLNMRNLGVGDAWDVLSGVDHLNEKGWVDPVRIGCMGWSQGGYISAFLTTSSDQFAAISVGAGISNWATYYYNTDITPFTINYLGDDPVDDPDIYEKTSPMSYIKQASTPTLIQHGEFDKRVPIPNAYELRQGLVDRGVPVEMVVYEGFGHGINKPKSQRAVMWHNLVWFNHYLWGDPLPGLGEPELPEKQENGEK
jgi:dipeptidyl aminopeptidase/acylaminoacyl peptidase